MLDVPGDIETSINFAIAELKAPSSPPSTEANQDEKEEFMLHVFARSSSNYALQVVEAQLGLVDILTLIYTHTPYLIHTHIVPTTLRIHMFCFMCDVLI